MSLTHREDHISWNIGKTLIDSLFFFEMKKKCLEELVHLWRPKIHSAFPLLHSDPRAERRNGLMFKESKECVWVCLDCSRLLPSQKIGVDWEHGRVFGLTPNSWIHAKKIVGRSLFSSTAGRTDGGKNLRQIIGTPAFW
jgi:hypothetical protein